MMKVGVYKQERYDQGVQKIQESIDNIAGLDVVRPEDKQYLQSKLNQLGSQLSMVAGGDFSNFQLVNSVNGMTNQIVKDPTVTNAVSNTAKYKKDLETVAKLQQEGKWADSNQLAFNKDANAWFQGGLDASYSANTSPYVDTTKEATDIVKAMAKDYTTEDVVFDYNEAGQIVGVRDALTRTKIEGITPQKIQTALKTGLSPQAWRQLSIDGQYKYSNVSSNAFVNDLNSSYQERFAEITSRRDMLENMLSNVTVAEQTRLGNLIKELDTQATDLKSEYNRISSGFAGGDVEGAKAQYYTMNWLDATSNAMSSKGESLTYHTNPYKTQQNFNRRMNQDAYFSQKRLDLSEARLLFDINKYNAEEAKKR
jgi:multidrug efflux pump subunit AcrB